MDNYSNSQVSAAAAAVASCRAAKAAARRVAALEDSLRCELLRALADRIEGPDAAALLEANACDLARMDRSNPLYDRLMLTQQRLSSIAADMRNVASLPSPLGLELYSSVLPNGLKLRKISVPFGVIGVIYEARPNVTFDVFSLCFKSGSACVLKGGSDARESNQAAIGLIREVLASFGLPTDAAVLLDATHEAASALLSAVGLVDLVIPRGGRRLIDFVRTHSQVPCIETGAGVVNTYFDAAGDLEVGKAIVLNAKTRRVSVCNALDCLLVHSSRLADLPELVGPLAASKVQIYADARSFAALDGRYPYLAEAGEDAFGTEWMDYKMSLRIVDSLDEAIAHIDRYGSGHSESIVTEDIAAAARFQAEVDAACVYVNAPTSFTDGAQFGLGAEIGISTQKLGARGPMGLREITTYKWLIEGHGQTRP
ncbi:MAG: glutamate-5-semialdehyde dehydrogenase [Bacteroidales bacterium]|nr:glutamate-5-semialdehyde dehydrogenase [Bacteroidales bacterium]